MNLNDREQVKALAAETQELCRFLISDLGIDCSAQHFEPAVDRLWHIVHVIRPKGKIGFADTDLTLVPALFLLIHPGVGVEKVGPQSPPSITDPSMVIQYRRMARAAIEGFLLVQELLR